MFIYLSLFESSYHILPHGVLLSKGQALEFAVGAFWHQRSMEASPHRGAKPRFVHKENNRSPEMHGKQEGILCNVWSCFKAILYELLRFAQDDAPTPSALEVTQRQAMRLKRFLKGVETCQSCLFSPIPENLRTEAMRRFCCALAGAAGMSVWRKFLH